MDRCSAQIADKPPELVGRIVSPRPYGQGVFRRFGVPLFDASLWTDAEEWSMEAPFALSIRYARSFAAYDLIERSLADMHRLEKLDAPLRRRYAASFEPLFRDVRRNDVITALSLPEEGVSFFYNSELTGVAEPALGRRFLDIWFSPRTTEPTLRAALLQLK
jgi:hypothetical protein